eukprot:3047426-Rhodomonas_salina.2
MLKRFGLMGTAGRRGDGRCGTAVLRAAGEGQLPGGTQGAYAPDKRGFVLTWRMPGTCLCARYERVGTDVAYTGDSA